MHVVIVGNGVAGMEAALTVRALDPHAKVTLIGAAIYATFLAWHVDLTAWLASSGITVSSDLVR